LLGACLGGLEVVVALRTSVTSMLDGMDRLMLWGWGALICGLVAGGIGLAASAGLGATLGQDAATRELASDTERDPRHPWLPWVLGLVLWIVLTLQVVPGVGAGRSSSLLLPLVLIGAAASSILLRFWIKKVDTTGKGMALTVLGLPIVLVMTMSLAVSSPMAGGKGNMIRTKSSTMNLLLITVDGLRFDHAGPGARIRTPAINWLAKEGVQFTQAVSPSSAEAPPVAALMTGRHPLSLDMLVDGQPLPGRIPGTNTSVPTLATKLRSEGYATGAFVSSAALDGQASGLGRGFSVYDDAMDEPLRGAANLALPTLLRWSASWGNTPGAVTVLRPAAMTLQRFDTWLAYHYAGSFFGWVHLDDPRVPFLAGSDDPQALVDPFPGEAGRASGARVALLDEMLTSLFRSLEADGLLKSTLIAVVGTRGMVPGARPSVDEGWVHVPVFLFGKGLEGPLVIEDQIRLQDLAPTLLSMVGFRHGRLGDGKTLVPLLSGQEMPTTEALSVGPPRGGPNSPVALRGSDWKFVRDSSGVERWYEIDSDPRELVDRREENAERAEAVSTQLRKVFGGEWPRPHRAPIDPGRKAQLRALEAAR
jgi:hypothetical protein